MFTSVFFSPFLTSSFFVSHFFVFPSTCLRFSTSSLLESHASYSFLFFFPRTRCFVHHSLFIEPLFFSFVLFLSSLSYSLFFPSCSPSSLSYFLMLSCPKLYFFKQKISLMMHNLNLEDHIIKTYYVFIRCKMINKYIRKNNTYRTMLHFIITQRCSVINCYSIF